MDNFERLQKIYNEKMAIAQEKRKRDKSEYNRLLDELVKKVNEIMIDYCFKNLLKIYKCHIPEDINLEKMDFIISCNSEDLKEISICPFFDNVRDSNVYSIDIKPIVEYVTILYKANHPLELKLCMIEDLYAKVSKLDLFKVSDCSSHNFITHTKKDEIKKLFNNKFEVIDKKNKKTVQKLAQQIDSEVEKAFLNNLNTFDTTEIEQLKDCCSASIFYEKFKNKRTITICFNVDKYKITIDLSEYDIEFDYFDILKYVFEQFKNDNKWMLSDYSCTNNSYQNVDRYYSYFEISLSDK